MKRTLFIPVLILFFLALALTGCTAIGSLGGSSEPTPLPVVTESAGVMAEGRVVPAEFAALSFAVRGEVAEINAAAGDRVDRGTVLIRLEDVESLQAALDAASLAELSARHQLDTLHRTADIARVGAQQELIAASLAVSQARMALDEYTTQEFRDELDDRELDVQEAKDDLEEKQDTLDKYLNLEEDNPTRKSAQQDVDEALAALHEAEYERDLLQAQHDQAQEALDLALARQAEAQRSLDARADGPDQEELALAEANLQAAQSQLAAAQAALDALVLTAPYDGTVMDIASLEVGETVNPGQVVATFANIEPWYVETRDLTELDVVRVEVGQEVAVTLDALPDVSLRGVVESISRVSAERSNDVLYTVRIRLEDTDPRVRWGMTVTVEFPE